MECVLLEEDPTRRTDRIAEAMLADAWFCRWVASDAHEVGWTVHGLAQGFASHRVASLTNHLGGDRCWQRPAEDEAKNLACAAVATCRAAREAAELAGEGGDLTTSSAYLSTMLQIGDGSTETVEVDGESLSLYLAIHDGIEWRLSRLVRQAARLTELEANFASVVQREKLDAMKELAYGASHEVNNPLANISGRAQAMLREETEPRRRRLLSAIDAQAMRAHEMISDLMLFARPPALEKTPTDLGKVVLQVLKELADDAATRQIAVDFQLPTTALVAQVDSTQMAIAVHALVRNAIEAIGNDGRIVVAIQSVAEGTGQPSLQITIKDTGPGITDEVRRHLFDPFYSGREAGRGLGFGLSKCWRIVTDHQGTVDIKSSEPSGAVVVIRIPAGEHARPTNQEA